jgi:mannitol/fructose-specific phosphotransferase system IIA component (Ntr-type)
LGGVEFPSHDGEPVRLVFLLLSPPTRTVDHLRALEVLTRHASDGGFRQAILQCATADEVRATATEWSPQLCSAIA